MKLKIFIIAALACFVPIAVLAQTPVVVAPTSVATTDKSLTLTTGGTAQTMIASNTARKVYCVQNPSATASGVAAESVWVRVNGTAAANVGTELANGTQACESGVTIDKSGVSVFAATTGHKINGFEKQ